MRILIWPVLIFLLLVLQTSWFGLFHSEQGPDLLLLFVVLWGMTNGRLQGGLLGAVIGLLQDFLTFSLPGFSVLTRALAGIVGGSYSDNVFQDRPFMFLFMAFVNSVLVKVLFLATMYFYKGDYVNWMQLTVASGRCILWNLVCALPLWLLFRAACAWVNSKGQTGNIYLSR